MAHRRYQIGKYPQYDHIYDSMRLDSQILNSARAKSMGIVDFIDIFTRNGLENSLRRWEVIRSEAEAHLKEIDDAFERHQQEKINAGRPKPQVMPRDMHERKLKAEARYDIILDELEELGKKLKTFTDKEEQSSNEAVLKGGPKGAGRLQNGQLVELDGQAVVADQDGVLRIRDSRSRYDGLSTADYHEKVVKVWAKACSKKSKEIDQKIKSGELQQRDVTRGMRKAPWPECPKIEKRKSA